MCGREACNVAFVVASVIVIAAMCDSGASSASVSPVPTEDECSLSQEVTSVLVQSSSEIWTKLMLMLIS